jgi:hypothetical protein
VNDHFISVSDACNINSHLIYNNEVFVNWNRILIYRICACINAAPTFLGQEFGNNSNLYISCTRFYLCESKIFAIAFATLWLSLAAFTVIYQ